MDGGSLQALIWTVADSMRIKPLSAHLVVQTQTCQGNPSVRYIADGSFCTYTKQVVVLCLPRRRGY